MNLQEFENEQDDLLDRLADIAERHNEVAMWFARSREADDDDEIFLPGELFDRWEMDHSAMWQALNHVKQALDACPLPPRNEDTSGKWFNIIFEILDSLDEIALTHLGTVDEAEQDADSPPTDP